MFDKRIDLSGDGRVYMNAYLYQATDEMPALKKRPAVVVCPGGGYWFCSAREADPIAVSYLSAGYHAFVLYYSLGKYAAYPGPICDLSRALAHIRAHSDEWGVREDQIAVCGFSAGGHLTACQGTLWNRPDIQAAAGVTGDQNRPNGLILGYPVITTDWMHTDEEQVYQRIAGSMRREQAEQLLNCDRNVGAHTPPAFLFHTAEDQVVPVTDSLRFATAMQQAGRPYELHVFPQGGHGAALATTLTGWAAPGVEQWMALSVNWLNRLFDFPPKA